MLQGLVLEGIEIQSIGLVTISANLLHAHRQQ
jgi:hypothetical protein